jgi:hypothetical protein
MKHHATADSRGHIYEYCECGAVRHLEERGNYDAWHVCNLCRTGAPCTKEPR